MSYLTATSTEFLLLVQQVNFLTSSFEWVVGGIGVSVAVTFIIVGYVQAKVNKNEIETLKNELKTNNDHSISKSAKELSQNIESKLRDSTDHLQAYVDDKWSILEGEIEDHRRKLDFESSRALAIMSNRDGLYNKSCSFWLSAANYCGDDEDMRINCINSAITQVESASESDFILFRNDIAEIQKEIEKLKPTHVMEMEIITKKLLRIIEGGEKEKKDLPALPATVNK
jgi:hypothetical protein